MPPLRQEGSLLNEASLRDLAEVAEGHRQQPHHDFSPKHDVDRWRALLVAAAEQDVYTTANVRTPGGGGRFAFVLWSSLF
jgi:hypothetical protein